MTPGARSVLWLGVLAIACSSTVEPNGRAVVTGTMTGPAGPLASATVRITTSDPGVELEAGSLQGAITGSDGRYTIGFFSSAFNTRDAVGTLSVTAPSGSGLRDTVINSIPILIRVPAETSIVNVALAP